MIYCVVPQALTDELYDKLVEYYKDDPKVEVIIDRRNCSKEKSDDGSSPSEDRRRPRIPGTFPKI